MWQDEILKLNFNNNNNYILTLKINTYIHIYFLIQTCKKNVTNEKSVN